MEYQDVMVEMELQGDKEKREITVCRDQLAHNVKFDLHLIVTIMSTDIDYSVWTLIQWRSTHPGLPGHGPGQLCSVPGQ